VAFDKLHSLTAQPRYPHARAIAQRFSKESKARCSEINLPRIRIGEERRRAN
jgi:hypothetical protein